MAEWQVTTYPLDAGKPARNSVVEYGATVTLAGVTSSKLAVNTKVPTETVLQSVSSKPEWVEEWRPMENGSDSELLRCALQKLDALLTFGTLHASSTSSEIMQRVYERYPDVGTALQTDFRQRYKSFGVLARIYDDGSSSWEYEIPEQGLLPPGIPGIPGIDRGVQARSDAGGQSLDDLIQSLVLADIRGKIATLG
jgi:hypothetical protein